VHKSIYGANFSVGVIWMTTDAENVIGYCARVSNPMNQDKPADKLIAYLIKHKHWSPFEMANLCVEIVTSRAISAQILRHRSFSFQEFSQRYIEVPDFMRYPARRQDESNRQNSTDDMDEHEQKWVGNVQQLVENTSANLYREALRRGIAKEQARFLLPMSSYTRIYMNGTIRSWIHYLNLRTGDDVQFEHREIARAIQQIFIREFPVISNALMWGEGWSDDG
jgi:thymidylate synthase (FAD)